MTTERQRPRITLLDVESTLGDFDLVEELNAHGPDYSDLGPDTKQISIYQCPSYLKSTLDILCIESNRHPSPSRNTAIVCCLSRTVSSLYDDDDIRGVIRSKQLLLQLMRTASDIEAAEYIEEKLRDFPMTLPGTSTKPVRLTVTVPLPKFREIHKLAEVTGMEKQTLVTLCITVVVAHQTHCNPAHARLAEETIEKFRKRLRLSARMIEDACQLVG